VNFPEKYVPPRDPDGRGGGASGERDEHQNEIEDRQVNLVDAATAVYKHFEDNFVRLKPGGRGVLEKAFDHVKHDVLPHLDVMQLEASRSIPAAAKFIEREVFRRLEDTVASVEQLEDIARNCPNLFGAMTTGEYREALKRVEERLKSGV